MGLAFGFGSPQWVRDRTVTDRVTSAMALSGVKAAQDSLKVFEQRKKENAE